MKFYEDEVFGRCVIGIRTLSMAFCRDTQDAKHLCRLLVPQEPHARLCISHRRKAAKDKHHSNIEEKRSFSTSIMHYALCIMHYEFCLSFPSTAQPQFRTILILKKNDFRSFSSTILNFPLSILNCRKTRQRFSTASLHSSLFTLIPALSPMSS